MLGRTRIHTRARGSGAGAGSTTTTDLQRLLALSPSLLIWPANGAGWQGTSGGTLAAVGQPLGLGADLSQLEGKTLDEWLATAPELATAPGLNWDGSAGVDTANIAAVESGKVYSLNYAGLSTIAINTVNLRVGLSALVPNVNITSSSPATGNITFVAPATGTLVVYASSNANSVGSWATVSLKALPGNHLRAGTWASPSDAARGTLQVSGGATWIDPSGVDDQYSFLTALSARAIVARVRVPTGVVDNDRFLVNESETDVLGIVPASTAWNATGSGAIRINGAASATYTLDVWQTLTVEWSGAQAFTRMWYSATGTRFGTMDVASLAVFNSALTSGDRAIAEAVIGATA